MDNNEFIIVVIILGVNELIDAFPDPSPFLSPTSLKIKKQKCGKRCDCFLFTGRFESVCGLCKKLQILVLLEMKEMC